MSESRKDDGDLGLREMLSQPPLRAYIFIGLSALLVYYMLMSARARSASEYGGGELGTLLTVVCAVPGLIFRWVLSPALFLIFMTFMLLDPNLERLGGFLQGDPYRLGFVTRKTPLNDVLLAASVLAYLIAQYRVLSFVHQSMPQDAPPRRKGQPAPKIPRRPFQLFAEKELLPLLGLGLLSILLGSLTWEFLTRYEGRADLGGTWGVTRPFARFMLFMWIITTLTVLAGVVFRQLSMQRMSRLQARLLLQDHVWQETRREQERIHRWQRWATSRTPSPNRAPSSSSWTLKRRLILGLIVAAILIAHAAFVTYYAYR